MSQNNSEVCASGGAARGTIALSLVLCSRVVYDAARGPIPSPSCSPLPPPTASGDGVVRRLSLNDPGDAASNSSSCAALLQFVRQDLKTAIGMRHTTTVTVTPTADSLAPVRLSIEIVVWNLSQGGELTSEETVSRLAPYIGQPSAFSSTRAFIGSNMRPSRILTINAAKSTLNGVPLVALKKHPQHPSEASIAEPIEIQPLSPLSLYRYKQLQERMGNDTRTSGRARQLRAVTMTPYNQEQHESFHLQQKHSTLSSYSKEQTNSTRSLSSRQQPLMSPLPSSDASLAETVGCRTTLSTLGTGQTGDCALTVPSNNGCTRPLPSSSPSPPQQLQQHKQQQRPMMRRAQVHVVSSLPDPLGLALFQPILLSSKALLAIKDDIVDRALVDCCKPSDVHVEVMVSCDAGAPSEVSSSSSPPTPAHPLHAGALHIVVEVPVRLELAAMYAVADHLLAPDALAAWLNAVRNLVGETYTPRVVDRVNTYVNDIPLSFFEDFLSRRWGPTAGVFLTPGNGDNTLGNDRASSKRTPSSSPLKTVTALQRSMPEEDEVPSMLTAEIEENDGYLQEMPSTAVRSMRVQEEIEQRRSHSQTVVAENELLEYGQLPPLSSPMFVGPNADPADLTCSHFESLSSLTEVSESESAQTIVNGGAWGQLWGSVGGGGGDGGAPFTSSDNEPKLFSSSRTALPADLTTMRPTEAQIPSNAPNRDDNGNAYDSRSSNPDNKNPNRRMDFCARSVLANVSGDANTQTAAATTRERKHTGEPATATLSSGDTGVGVVRMKPITTKGGGEHGTASEVPSVPMTDTVKSPSISRSSRVNDKTGNDEMHVRQRQTYEEASDDATATSSDGEVIFHALITFNLTQHDRKLMTQLKRRAKEVQEMYRHDWQDALRDAVLEHASKVQSSEPPFRHSLQSERTIVSPFAGDTRVVEGQDRWRVRVTNDGAKDNINGSSCMLEDALRLEAERDGTRRPLCITLLCVIHMTFMRPPSIASYASLSAALGNYEESEGSVVLGMMLDYLTSPTNFKRIRRFCADHVFNGRSNRSININSPLLSSRSTERNSGACDLLQVDFSRSFINGVTLSSLLDER
ncbi:hypothetical protein DQ04_00941010 [Trypanosoma grayi]|uniref:hypothetical protein n=1 Tax=Trypanosoma grayi TaxID=71804 RepID=UPI0004F4B98C|nr:hypothetical protein DQ04_00941010 [Trypanosoma grayi]KEG13537.1 hypothetical protein DQ04_00941010 [Trypanosoma grayi]